MIIDQAKNQELFESSLHNPKFTGALRCATIAFILWAVASSLQYEIEMRNQPNAQVAKK